LATSGMAKHVPIVTRFSLLIVLKSFILEKYSVESSSLCLVDLGVDLNHASLYDLDL